MDNNILLKNKNIILNTGVILLALFISLQIYKADNQEVSSLIQQKDNELKKNAIIENIDLLEKKIDSYKKLFSKKDLTYIMAQISNIAKNNAIKIISIKPSNEEKYSDYIKVSFLISVNSPNYHALGKFISQIENNKDIYLIEELDIVSAVSSHQQEGTSRGLNVNLKISMIYFI